MIHCWTTRDTKGHTSSSISSPRARTLFLKKVTERFISRSPSSSERSTKDRKMPASLKGLQQMAIYLGVVCGGGCALMYHYMQKTFAKSGYYQAALEHLANQPSALEVLGAPPLKVHNISLTDRYNHVDKQTAQIRIPVSGTKSAGYLYTTSIKDFSQSRWCLHEVILQLRDGQCIPVYHSSTSSNDMEQR
uniref:Cytochrome c oxidase assembly factor 1 homolog n=1 Tax=Geotrypetes seraphini TaxID=260995 RepID=A0A6P8PQJ8_GEOSA|nr:cytochrome c oxidase assembly factor 1 homolog [Geotrypetes seraphini]XP_033786183.1 cytochrome c oxidase assembly factor 1 homolog [Geotrypetes seraphini]XP_033786184.1 cytochrome c oxidase assembly factor 1 homolog [Geotrypetes seraphini]